MIDQLTVRHFQSLDDIDLALGGFTVIVGRSSSGKSALVRSLRALVGNVRGTASVARSAVPATLLIRAGLDGGYVALQRGKINAYEYGVDPWATGNPRFTKIGAGVPEEITKALGIPADGGLSFAGQFDPPFLLSDTGSAVARTLGELTNVDVLYGAAREANRRRLTVATTIKVRQVDLEKATAELAEYSGLDDELARQAELTDRAAVLTTDRTRLMGLLSTLGKVQQATAVLAQQAPALELPDPAELIEAARRLRDLDRLLVRLRSAYDQQARLPSQALLAKELVLAGQEVADAREAVAQLAEVCPACGAEKVHWRSPGHRVHQEVLT